MIEDLKFQQLEAACRYMADNKSLLPTYGDIFEFGVYNGASLTKLLKLLDKYQINRGIIVGIDSFEGLPETDPGFSKFTKGAYKSSKTLEDLTNQFNKEVYFIKKQFKDLTHLDAAPYLQAQLIHIDCDLYSSTVDALDFMFKNKLVQPGTLIAYDEFAIDEDNYIISEFDKNKGEVHAHFEIMEKYRCIAKEVWHYIYKDKDLGTPVRQSLFEVVSL